MNSRQSGLTLKGLNIDDINAKCCYAKLSKFSEKAQLSAFIGRLASHMPVCV